MTTIDFSYSLQALRMGAGELAQGLRVPASLEESLGSVPSTYMVPATPVPGDPTSLTSWAPQDHSAPADTQAYTHTVN